MSDLTAERILADIKAAVALVKALPRPQRLDFSKAVSPGCMYVAFGDPFDIVILPWKERERPELAEAAKLAAYEMREWKPRFPSQEEIERWQQAERRGS